MLALAAAYLGLLVMLGVSAFAADQVRRGGLDHIMRSGLVVNLAGAAVLWLRTDKPVEGPVLLIIRPGHGITVADVLVALPLALAARVVLGGLSWRDLKART